MRIALLTCILLLAGALAGCADDNKSDTHTDPPCDVCDKVTDTTGIAHGVVVDSAIRPIAGATVTVAYEGGEQTTETDEEGRFGFADLPPGDVFLRISKAGYFAVQQAVSVVAGDDDPDVVRVLLESDPETRPYVSVQQYTGFIECSFRVRDGTGATSAVFGQPYYYGHNTCNGFGNQLTNFPIEYDMPPTWVQGELSWESSQATGSGLSLVLGPQDCRDIKWDRADGTSPQVATLNATVVQENDDLASQDGSCFRVFTWSAPEAGDSLGASLGQEFSLIVHVFYNMEPEAGWSFGANGAPPVPT